MKTTNEREIVKMIIGKQKGLLGQNVAGVNQICPVLYPWAWETYLKAVANNWVPTEVSMLKDKEHWHSPTALTDDERLMIKRCMGFFAGSESLVANNLLLAIFKYVTNPETRQYIGRQNYEECYIDGTEVLTPSGWKDLSLIHEGDIIAQYNPNGTIEFVACAHTVAREIEDEIVAFNDDSGRVSLRVTQGHRMAFLDEKTLDLGFQEAKDITYAHKNLPVAGSLIGTNNHLTDWERFLIVFQADGSYIPGKNRDGSRIGAHPVAFKFQKQRKIIRLREILGKLGFKYTEIVTPRGQTSFYVRVPLSYQLDKEFTWVDFEGKSSLWCREFIEEIVQWDGWQMDGVRRTGYDTTNKFNADVVQAIAVLGGFKTSFGHYDKGDYKRLHRLSFNDNQSFIGRGSVKKSLEPYAGKVYCATVSSGALVVRQDDCVAICGNCLHNHTVVYVCDSLGLDVNEIYEAYANVEAIKRKDDFLMGITSDLSRNDFTTATIDGKREFLRNLFTYYVICEGIMFFSGFAMLLSLKNRNLMVGIGEQIEYTLRDESLHIAFGINLINAIREEYPEIWDAAFEQEIISYIKTAVDLEIAYAKDVLPNGILGLNADMFVEYTHFIANRRLEALNLPFRYETDKNPFPWLAEVIDLRKNKNFFETRVTDYQMGTVVDDF